MRVTFAITGARIMTGDPRRPWADALAVADGHVVALGSSAEVRKLAGDAPTWHAPGAVVTARTADWRLARGSEATFLVRDTTGATLLEVQSGAVTFAAPDVPLATHRR